MSDAPGRARLRWQCRRGMRELDVLLGRWLERCYDAADEPRKAAFERLLELSDPELAAYLLRGVSADDPLLDNVITDIRSNTPA